MALNRLCYILPTETENESEFEQSKVLETEKRHERKNRRMKNCHDQIFSVFRRTIKRVVVNGSGLCGKNIKNSDSERVVYHDIGGIKFPDAVKMDTTMYNPKIFSFSELYIGTNGFSEDKVLGSGGFGRVYKAKLPSDGTYVAVKCLLNNKKSSNVDKTFMAELLSVANLRHRNLVRLRGWCVHELQLLLVYDYMPNSSLDKILFNNSNSGVHLDFVRRGKIVLGLAAALFYLHEQLETQIIHRDIKTSNVMLDSQYNARLGDFGLARWLEHDYENAGSQLQTPVNKAGTTHENGIMKFSSSRRSSDYHQFRVAETTRIGGTIGYLPPESFQKRYTANAKSDVFSFGIVVLEVASGRRAVDLTFPDDKIILLDWVRRLADDGRLVLGADTRLSYGSYQPKDMERLIHLGLLCTLQNPKSRPNIKWCLDVLCGNLIGELPSLPSFKSHPLYISLSSSSETSTTSLSSSSISTIYITAHGKTIFITAQDISSPNEEDSTQSTNINTNSNSEIQTSPSLKSPVSFPIVETPKEISYKDIVSATRNFSDSHRVAEVDFGTAYQGFLEDRHVLVKRLGMKTCPALRARFSNELQNLGRLRHRNLAQLRGWCTEQGEMLVIYDYLPTHLLTHLLFHSKCNPLKWNHRYNIIKSLASAIVYLHEEWDEQVIHRNITSSSIVLDADMNPRLTAFALAEFLTRYEHGHHHVGPTENSVRGIFGYMAPEYMESGEANPAADVYSFGVVVLEIVTGRMAVDFRFPEVLLVKRIREFEATGRALEDLADPQLGNEFEYEELVRLMKLGISCTNSDPNLRPSMRQITSILDGNRNLFRECSLEGIEEWKEANKYSLRLIRRIQALGIQ